VFSCLFGIELLVFDFAGLQNIFGEGFKDGFLLEAEARVDVAPVSNAEDLHQLLVKAIGRGNPVVKTPTRENFPRPVMEQHCGMKSLSAFERTANLWAIGIRDDAYVFYPWRRSTRYRGAWEEDHDQRTTLSLSTPLEEVARHAAERAFNER
jgi:hypothetical protein